MLENGMFYKNYDLDATTYKYGRFRDQIQGVGGVKTTGSSVTVNAVTSGIGTFSGVKVGDLIVFYRSDTLIDVRKIATKPSNDQITVDTAVNLDNSGAGFGAWFFQSFDIGTTSADGWLPVQKFGSKKGVRVVIATLNAAGGMDVSIESKGYAFDTVPVVLIEQHYDVPKTEHFPVPEEVLSLRVGVKGTTGFAGADDVSIYLIGDAVRGA